jgi:hypothetical protein
MLGAAADLAQLAGAAPWLAVGALCLAASAWIYRQQRRGLVEARRESAASAARQGKRLGELERETALLKLRRQQVEWVLLDLGIPLPMWPPDGPDQPRPRRRNVDEDLADDVDEDLADDVEPMTTERRIPVPPLPLDLGARHRRASDRR